MEQSKITVIGAGYVGLPYAALLSRCETVTLVDTDRAKLAGIERHIVPFRDTLLESWLENEKLDLHPVPYEEADCAGSDYVLIAVPTNFDSAAGRFDTSAVEQTLRWVTKQNPTATVIVKSTVPIGFTAAVRKSLGNPRILFSPEFLRENYALEDVLHPSRVIFGLDPADAQLVKAAKRFAALLSACGADADAPVLYMDFPEAESVKLFANSYLAVRVAFFNELDTFAQERGLSAEAIIQGVCSDPRVGSFYNNPSFGYGGYCLPKDTRQLLTDFGATPQYVVRAAVEQNEYRAAYVARKIMSSVAESGEAPIIGIFSLSMKSGSSDCRNAAILPVIRHLLSMGARILIYDRALTGQSPIPGTELVSDLERFKAQSQIIVANRRDACLDDVAVKVFSRDLFGRD